MSGTIVIRKIRPDETEKVKQLADAVIACLERKEFFLPIGEEGIEEMFDPEKAVTYGAFDEDRLAGTAQLYLGDSLVEKEKKLAGIPHSRTAELGGFLVRKEYRCQGIMKKLAQLLVQEAEERKFEYILFTAHPDNIASEKVILFCGGQFVKKTEIEGYERNIYLLKLNK